RRPGWRGTRPRCIAGREAGTGSRQPPGFLRRLGGAVAEADVARRGRAGVGDGAARTGPLAQQWPADERPGLRGGVLVQARGADATPSRRAGEDLALAPT